MDWHSDIRDLLAVAASRMERRCPYCATPLESDVQCCPQCGEDLTGLVARPPLHAAYYRQAHQQYEAGELSQSLESLELCLRLVPDYAPALRLSAGVSALVGHVERASLRAAQLLDLLPTDPTGLRLAAAIGAARGEGSTALCSESAMTARASTRDTRLVRPWTLAASWKRPCRTVLAAVVGGAGLSALLQWAISRTRRQTTGGNLPGS